MKLIAIITAILLMFTAAGGGTKKPQKHTKGIGQPAYHEPACGIGEAAYHEPGT